MVGTGTLLDKGWDDCAASFFPEEKPTDTEVAGGIAEGTG